MTQLGVDAWDDESGRAWPATFRTVKEVVLARAERSELAAWPATCISDAALSEVEQWFGVS